MRVCLSCVVVTLQDGGGGLTVSLFVVVVMLVMVLLFFCFIFTLEHCRFRGENSYVVPNGGSNQTVWGGPCPQNFGIFFPCHSKNVQNNSQRLHTSLEPRKNFGNILFFWGRVCGNHALKNYISLYDDDLPWPCPPLWICHW